MNTRLKIICILFGVIYFYFLGATIVNEIPSFNEGRREGAKKAEGLFNNVGSEKTTQTKTLFFKLKPISGTYSFPSSVLNLKTGNPISTEISVAAAKINSAKLSSWVKFAYEIVILLIAFPTLFVIVFIPILIYRVIRSIVKNEIFELRNIRRIRWIGYCLLFIFAVETYVNFIHTFLAREFIQLEGYRIVFHIGDEFYWLLFALVTLMFAEILKMSHTMKEEQELTI